MRERRNKALLDSEWIADTQINNQPSGDHLLDIFLINLETWASQAGICLSSEINESLLGIDEWDALLERQITEIKTDVSNLTPLG